MDLSVEIEAWPISGGFAISRGEKTEATVVVVTLRDENYVGRGECVPYMRYGETIGSVQGQIRSVAEKIASGADRYELKKLLPPGAARNALDCALWDLEAKRRNTTVWKLVGITPKPMTTAFTISLDTPEKMAERAAEAAPKYSLLKIKLGADGDEDRLKKIREAAPKARLIVDANEGWTEETLKRMLPVCESVSVELIEQPVPAAHSNILQNYGKRNILLCADESVHTSGDIPELLGRYGAINIKLDKAGGLTEALDMARVARTAGLKVMVGCHVSTSLSMAPATVVAQYAEYVDLDGPLLLARDREPSIEYRDGMILPTTSDLWG